MSLTPLDKAFIAADKHPEERMAFYTLFLNSIIYLPNQLPPEEYAKPGSFSTEQESAGRRVGENETVHPLILESNGIAHVMLFDTLEKLRAFAPGAAYIGIPGHAVVEMLNSDFHWALNAGSELTKIFIPDEINWLKEYTAQAKGQRMTMEANTHVMISGPKIIPHGLVETLKDIIEQRCPEVRAAYLGQVHINQPGEIPHLMLVVTVDPSTDIIMDGLRKDLIASTAGFLKEDEYLDFQFDDGGTLATEIKKAVQPFYVRSH